MITLLHHGPILITLLWGSIILCGCREYSQIKETYESGKPKIEIIYKIPLFGAESIAVKEIHYHFNGNEKSVTEIKKNGPEGLTRAWWINGRPKFRGQIKSGSRQGLWEFFFEKNASLSSSGKYLDDKKNGIWKEFWPNGRKKSTGLYQNDKKKGRWITRDSTGRLIEDNSCFEQNDSGTYISYYTGGREYKRYQCLKGTPQGAFIALSPGGIVLEEGSYNNSGQKEGIWITRYESNLMASSQVFKNGLLNDTARHWDKLGRIISLGFFKSGTGTLNKFFPDGKLKMSEDFLKGKKQGGHISYYKNGGIKSRMIYNKDLPVSYERWYESKNKKYGQLAVTGRYKYGKRHEEWKWYFPSGKLSETCQYKDGKKHGIARYYDQKTGNLQRTQYFENGAETKAVLEPEFM